MDLFFFPYSFPVGMSLETGLLTAQVEMVVTRSAVLPLSRVSQLGRGGQSPSASKLDLYTYCLPAPGQTVLQPPPSSAFPHLEKTWVLRASTALSLFSP